MATDDEADEIELDPVETAPDGEGNAQSVPALAGSEGERGDVRPSTPFARAVDHPVIHGPVAHGIVDNRPGAGWRRLTPAKAVRYCRGCGIALPVVVRPRCETCGAVQRLI